MHINTLADKLRAVLPSVLWESLRKSSNAILGPLHFSLETGHFRSAIASKAMDRHGNPIPWFTYPAVQFLMMKRFDGRTVLEWGAGQSTLFWARRAEHVTSLEADRLWYDKLVQSKPSNVSLHLVRNDLSDADSVLCGKKWDLIVCDGLDRYRCAERSIPLLKDGGAIIIDNSDGNQGPRTGYGFIELYREAGFSRVDFYGFPPGNTVQQATSLFFRESCFLLAGQENPWPPLSFWEYPAEVMASWQSPREQPRVK